MARAGPSRSQRAPQPSQSQPRGSRRAPRRGDPEDDEEEGEEEGEVENEVVEDEDVEMDAGGATQGSKSDELTRKANDLVRLALFTEHKRTPLRREDINKKGVSRYTMNILTQH
jgi:melanoma-associated antigen